MAVEETNHGYSHLWLQIHVLQIEKLNADNSIIQSFQQVLDGKKKSKNEYDNFTLSSYISLASRYQIMYWTQICLISKTEHL